MACGCVSANLRSLTLLLKISRLDRQEPIGAVSVKIVVVDSSRVVTRAVADCLRQRGNDVVTFTDSVQALEHVRADCDVRAVLTGLETRPFDGYETCWALRLLANAGRPLHIIAMSSFARARNLSEALDAGADDFISKPPVPEELHARIRAAERMTTMQEALLRQARTDMLSGLNNRRAFFDWVEAHQLEARRSQAREAPPLAIVLADLDRFKRLNDNYGHDCGDAAIRHTGAVFSDNARRHGGCAARFGGEEFILAAPVADIAEAQHIAETLRTTIAAAPVRHDGGEVVVTGSFGIALQEAGENIDALIRRADAALYHAKAEGRNRVACSPETVRDCGPVPAIRHAGTAAAGG
jgi:two-component system cell cycle response regulator